MSAPLAVRGVSAAYRSEPVLWDVSFTIPEGRLVGIVGPNGAGKTTLLRIIAGLLPAAEGRVTLSGGTEPWPDAAAACHYLGHLNAMKAALTVEENLAFWRAFLGATGLSPHEALEAVGLGGIGHLPFAYLSAGQRRRTAIARLLVSHRPLWLLDEPTASLDQASAARFSALMREHLEAGGIIVAATHLPLGFETAEELRMGERQ